MALRLFASQAAAALRIRSSASLQRHLVAPLVRAYSAAAEDRKYLTSHEWVAVDGDVATVGISDHAQTALGEVVFVELPETGTAVEKSSTFGVVESVKAASDVYSPISGTVVETNAELKSNPGLVNSGPHSDGWFIKVKVEKPEELHELLDEAAYKAHVDASH